VADLGDLLELLHRASGSFRTFQGEFRTVDHPDVTNQALRAMRDETQRTPSRERRSGGSGSFSGSFFFGIDEDEDDESAEPVESVLRLWLDRDGHRYREEQGDGEDIQLIVRDGRRWWSFNALVGATSNEGEDDSSRSTVTGSGEVLLTPSKLLGALQFEPTGEGVRAGRAVVRARAKPDPDLNRADLRGLSDFGWGADAYELEVDVERGVLLRVASHFKGAELSLVEAVRVTFDEPLGDDTFVFRSPDGSMPVAESQPALEPLPIHEVARRAPFEVFALAGMPEGWTPFATFSPAQKRPPRAAQVSLTYLAASGAGTVFIQQQRQDDDVGAPGPKRSVEREVVRDGVTVEVVEPIGTYHTVRLILEGTHLAITSSDLDVEQLIELATRFRPAPSEPEPI